MIATHVTAKTFYTRSYAENFAQARIDRGMPAVVHDFGSYFVVEYEAVGAADEDESKS